MAECGGVPELIDGCAGFDQAAGHVPASVADRVVQRRTDRAVGGFDVGTCLDQDVGDVDVVGAGHPVPRCLAVALAFRSRLRVRAGSDEYFGDR